MRIRTHVLPVLLSVFVGFGCTPNIGSPEIAVKEAATEDYSNSKSVTESGLTKYQAAGISGALSWVSCVKDPKAEGVLAINPDTVPWKDDACSRAVPQAFLDQGLNVLAINRPGFGASTPANGDFSGPRTVAALRNVFLDLAKQKKWMEGVHTVWGFSSGAIAACLFAKDFAAIRRLVLGNGIFDLEAFAESTKDKSSLDAVAKAKVKDDSKFYENRSPAWDSRGLPKQIYIYHGKSDQIVSSSQSYDFHEILKTEGYDVRLQEIDNVGHDISEKEHRYILTTLTK